MKGIYKKLVFLVFIGIILQGTYLNFKPVNSSSDFSDFYDFLN